MILAASTIPHFLDHLPWPGAVVSIAFLALLGWIVYCVARWG